jgi:uncharacterized protein (TIGR03437 family)
LGRATAGLPVTRGALQGSCVTPSCFDGYAARLTPALDRVAFGTYLPGAYVTAKVFAPDGSIYFAGFTSGAFPTSATAFQRQPAGGEDGFVARLDPAGTRLLFATYLGGPGDERIRQIAVAADGTVWAASRTGTPDLRLVRLDAAGEKLLVRKNLDARDLLTEAGDNVYATLDGGLTPTADALVGAPCSPYSLIKLNAAGETLFATYLPWPSIFEFAGLSGGGRPVFELFDTQRFEIVEGRTGGPFAGCLVDAGTFNSTQAVSPGAIVTLFGSQLGPSPGVSFQLENGRVPTTLGGIRILVDGEPAPLLYVSDSQVNLVLPYSLAIDARPAIQVISGAGSGNLLPGIFVERARLTLFRLDSNGRAAAVNEDGSINSPANPARPGSRVALFGTGGGVTAPPSTAGEVTPLELRRLEFGLSVQVLAGPTLGAEFAGAAPGLVAGVVQINIKVPETIPDIPGYARGILPLSVGTPGAAGGRPGVATIAVRTN